VAVHVTNEPVRIDKVVVLLFGWMNGLYSVLRRYVFNRQIVRFTTGGIECTAVGKVDNAA
jgi:hypothetical protein